MLPEHAPFNPEQRHTLSQLLPAFSPTQSAWLSGYLAAGAADPSQAASAAASQELTVLYGTESGNSEELAAKTVKLAKKNGFKGKMVNMADLKPENLAQSKKLLVIVSTWGEGDPPESAESFVKDFMSKELSLAGVEFSLCALGDTSYERFCQIGKDIDARLEALGAKRVADRVDCDVDYEESYETWVEKALKALDSGASAPATEFPIYEVSSSTIFDKKNPFPAEVISNILLNGHGSAKETIHVELGLEGSGLTYEAGDALAVIPVNAPDVVADILSITGLDGGFKVTPKGREETSLIEALTHSLDITALSRAVAKKWAELAKSEELNTLLDDEHKDDFKNYVLGRQVVDILREYPSRDIAPQMFVNCLRKLPPRLYSIASSSKAHEGEVHLTVAAVRYHTYNKHRKGVASTYLADFAHMGEKVFVYVHKNKNFRLPEDPKVPIIMVGSGTGIAPFRAFVEERSETENAGESWLFFGDQKYSYDFLYQLEWQDHLKEGALTRLDLAFSRDQPEKIYVQDRITEKGEEVFSWLERGANFYVCGDANRMANDVHEALVSLVEEHGKKSRAEAEAYVDAMKKEKRYQRDVY